MMIRHAPFGSGHPYMDDTDQRSPRVPIAGEPLRIGARTSADVDSVQLRVETKTVSGEITVDSFDCLRVNPTGRGKSTDSGHLAAAQEGKQKSAHGWEHTLLVEPKVRSLRYQLVAHSSGSVRSTRWFEADVAVWKDASSQSIRVDGKPGAISIDDVSVLATEERLRRVRFALPLEADEHVAGFGERFDRLDQKGMCLDAQVFEQYKSQGAERRTYLPMPFAHVVGGRGWGFHLDTSRRSWFDVGKTESGKILIEADVDVPADSTEVATLRLFEGTPTAVLDQFLDEVGRPEEMPDWVFRLWASGNEWNTQSLVEQQVTLHKQHRIPVGSVVIEAWSDESTFTVWRDAIYEPNPTGGPLQLADFTYPEDGAWPNPKAMIDRMHEDGVKVLLWQIPLIKMRPHPQGQTRFDADAAIREGYLIEERTPDGKLRPYRNRGWWFPLALMPDLTDQRAADWWASKRRYLVEEMGVDGFKTDGGEHAWGDDLVYLNGTGGADSNNLFPVAYSKTFGDLLEDVGKDRVTFSRAGFTGSQAQGLFWAGDENSTWDAFKWSMWAGLSAAASGITYWGWDIAGFSGPLPEPELYTRAFATSVFVPIMQYHSEFNHHRKPSRDRTPWNMAERFGEPQIIDEIREIVELRERLIPYLTKNAKQSIRTSKPLMRPLFFDYPKDPDAWTQEPQWLCGDDILVAPIFQPGEEKDVYLPVGQWRDAWDGQVLEGGQVVRTRTPRHRVPAFVKEEAWDQLCQVFTGN